MASTRRAGGECYRLVAAFLAESAPCAPLYVGGGDFIAPPGAICLLLPAVRGRSSLGGLAGAVFDDGVLGAAYLSSLAIALKSFLLPLFNFDFANLSCLADGCGLISMANSSLVSDVSARPTIPDVFGSLTLSGFKTVGLSFASELLPVSAAIVISTVVNSLLVWERTVFPLFGGSGLALAGDCLAGDCLAGDVVLLLLLLCLAVATAGLVAPVFTGPSDTVWKFSVD